jgi:hypothetical protein
MILLMQLNQPDASIAAHQGDREGANKALDTALERATSQRAKLLEDWITQTGDQLHLDLLGPLVESTLLTFDRVSQIRHSIDNTMSKRSA